MKIAFDAKRLFTHSGSLGKYSRLAVLSLSRTFPEAEYRLYTPKIVDSAATRPLLRSGNCHAVIPMGVLSGSLWRTFGQAAQMRGEEIQLFHGLSGEIPLGLRGAKIPAVVTIHGRDKRSEGAADRAIVSAKERFACRQADRVVVLTEARRRDLISRHGLREERVIALPPPVAAPNASFPRRERAEALLRAKEAVPGLPDEFCLIAPPPSDSGRAVTRLFEALRIIPDDSRPFLLVLGTSAHSELWRQKVLSLIEESGLSRSVSLAPKIRTPEVIQALFSSALCLIAPVSDPVFDFEAAEASILACPIAAADLPELRETFGPSASYFAPDDADALAQALQALLSDDERRQALGVRCAEYAEQRFSPDLHGKALMALYDSVLNSAGG